LVLTEILARSLAELGAKARTLCGAAVAGDARCRRRPRRPGMLRDIAVDSTCRFYHIRHSRARVAKPIARVKEPRHLLAIVPNPVPRELAVARLRAAEARDPPR
jgi:hypothetical protein